MADEVSGRSSDTLSAETTEDVRYNCSNGSFIVGLQLVLVLVLQQRVRLCQLVVLRLERLSHTSRANGPRQPCLRNLSSKAGPTCIRSRRSGISSNRFFIFSKVASLFLRLSEACFCTSISSRRESISCVSFSSIAICHPSQSVAC